MTHTIHHHIIHHHACARAPSFGGRTSESSGWSSQARQRQEARAGCGVQHHVRTRRTLAALLPRSRDFVVVSQAYAYRMRSSFVRFRGRCGGARRGSRGRPLLLRGVVGFVVVVVVVVRLCCSPRSRRAPREEARDRGALRLGLTRALLLLHLLIPGRRARRGRRRRCRTSR